MFDGEAFGNQMVDIVRGYVAAEIEPLRAANQALAAENKALAERLAAVEAREMPDVTGLCSAEDAALLVADGIARLAADLPKGVEIEAVEALIAAKQVSAEVDMDAVAELIDKAVAEIPRPEDGKSVDMAEVEQVIAERVKAAVEALPVPNDGIGLASAFKDQDGCLILTMTNGETRDLGPIDGKNGATFTLDDFEVVPMDERTIKMGFTYGEVMHSFELEFPVPIYRGVFKEGQEYARGDMVTWAGSVYHAEKATTEKPGTDDWTLAVKAGRHGRDAR